MTVKELRDKLAKFDDKSDVVVYWENESGSIILEIVELS
jgi:hypothetical protein